MKKIKRTVKHIGTILLMSSVVYLCALKTLIKPRGNYETPK